MQKPEELLDKDVMSRAGVTWIRRPTGGRAVLHCGDITYSCVFSKRIAEMGLSIAETYNSISQCLMKGLALSYINCTSHDFSIDLKEINREVKLPCFLAPNRNEVMVNGKKLIGSAQKRTADAVLQHGSIPLTGEFRDLPLYQKINKDKRSAFTRLLHQKCTCIEECLPSFKVDMIVKNLKQGFADILPFDMETTTWNSDEEKMIQEIADGDKFQRQWMR